MHWRQGPARTLSAFCFITIICAGLFSTAIYIRSKYRSDVVTVVVPGNYCMVVSCDNGLFDIGLINPFFSHPLVAWTSSLPYLQNLSVGEPTKLHGPALNSWLESNSLARSPYTIAKAFHRWRQFYFGYYIDTWYHRVNDEDPIFRSWRGLSDDDNRYFEVIRYFDYLHRSLPNEIFIEKLYAISLPVWALPLGFAIAACLWLVTVGRRRWVRYSRRKKGQCVRCGYDLRQSPSKCPECGLDISPDVSSTGGWRIAFGGVFSVFFGFALFLNWMNPIAECKPSMDARAPSQIGMAIPWNQDLIDHADPIESALGDNGPYTVRVETPDKDSCTITILRDDKIICSWHGDSHSVFKIDHDVLYREDHLGGRDDTEAAGDGVTIFAIDLHTGREPWHSDLRDAPNSYFNSHEKARRGFEVRKDRLFIWGDEPAGRYAEVKDIHTGKTIGYCIYERPSTTKPADWGELKGTRAREPIYRIYGSRPLQFYRWSLPATA